MEIFACANINMREMNENRQWVKTNTCEVNIFVMRENKYLSGKKIQEGNCTRVPHAISV